jgi:hypothetical protein
MKKENLERERESAAPKEPVYGLPCVENPHDFEPDQECCTPAEIAFWEDAKKRWDAGECDVRGARCGSVYDENGQLKMHVTRTSWGIGINYVDMAEMFGEEKIDEAKS